MTGNAKSLALMVLLGLFIVLAPGHGGQSAEAAEIAGSDPELCEVVLPEPPHQVGGTNCVPEQHIQVVAFVQSSTAADTSQPENGLHDAGVGLSAIPEICPSLAVCDPWIPVYKSAMSTSPAAEAQSDGSLISDFHWQHAGEWYYGYYNTRTGQVDQVGRVFIASDLILNGALGDWRARLFWRSGASVSNIRHAFVCLRADKWRSSKICSDSNQSNGTMLWTASSSMDIEQKGVSQHEYRDEYWYK